MFDAESFGKTWTRAAAVERLVSAWCGAVQAEGWAGPGSWWVPEVDGFAAEFLDQVDLRPAARRLGAARAGAGVRLEPAIEDLRILARVAGRDVSVGGVRLALVAGWESVGVVAQLVGGQFRARLRHLLAAGRPVDGFRLTVWELPADPDPWNRAAAQEVLLDRLRRTPGIAAVTAVGEHRVLALTSAGVDGAEPDPAGLFVWWEQLPSTWQQTQELLAELAR